MLIDYESMPLVAVEFMNADHREVGRRLEGLALAIEAYRSGHGSTSAVAIAWKALENHTRAHFAREDAAMTRLAFPRASIHKAEHRIALARMREEELAFTSKEDIERLGRFVLGGMPDWFRHHVEAMDLITARYIASKGG